MKSRRRVTSSLFRKAAAATTLRPPVRMSRGSANASWNPGSVFSSRAVNFLLLIVVLAAVLFLLFVGIPNLVEGKKQREPTRMFNPAAPPENK